MNYLTSRFYAELRQTITTPWLDCPECSFPDTRFNSDGSITCVGCGYEWNPKQ